MSGNPEFPDFLLYNFLIPAIDQTHDHLYHHVLFIGFAFCDHQGKSYEGIIGNSF
jgi:hypothetical protein